MLQDGSTEREFGLDPLGDVVYRFRKSHQRHTASIFVGDPWDLPTTSVEASDYLSLTLDDVHGEYVSREEFDRVWRASARLSIASARIRFGRSMLALRRARSRRKPQRHRRATLHGPDRRPDRWLIKGRAMRAPSRPAMSKIAALRGDAAERSVSVGGSASGTRTASASDRSTTCSSAG